LFQCRLVSPRIREILRQVNETVQIATGAWYDPACPGQGGALCRNGIPIVLTLDKGTSRLAQGPIAHACPIEVEKFEGEVPEGIAFKPTEIIEASN